MRYVPATRQSDLLQIDATDNLLRKHLVTYSLRTRLQDERSGKRPATVDGRDDRPKLPSRFRARFNAKVLGRVGGGRRLNFR